MNECIGHVIGKPHSPVTGLYLGKRQLQHCCSTPAPASASFVVALLPVASASLGIFGKGTAAVRGVQCARRQLRGRSLSAGRRAPAQAPGLASSTALTHHTPSALPGSLFSGRGDLERVSLEGQEPFLWQVGECQGPARLHC